MLNFKERVIGALVKNKISQVMVDKRAHGLKLVKGLFLKREFPRGFDPQINHSRGIFKDRK